MEKADLLYMKPYRLCFILLHAKTRNHIRSQELPKLKKPLPQPAKSVPKAGMPTPLRHKEKKYHSSGVPNIPVDIKKNIFFIIKSTPSPPSPVEVRETTVR